MGHSILSFLQESVAPARSQPTAIPASSCDCVQQPGLLDLGRFELLLGSSTGRLCLLEEHVHDVIEDVVLCRVRAEQECEDEGEEVSDANNVAE